MGARPLWSADIPPGVGSHLKCRMGLAMVGVLSSKGSMMLVKPTGGGRDSLRASHDPAHSATPPSPSTRPPPLTFLSEWHQPSEAQSYNPGP